MTINNSAGILGFSKPRLHQKSVNICVKSYATLEFKKDSTLSKLKSEKLTMCIVL